VPGGHAHKPILQSANESGDRSRGPQAADKRHTAIFIIACPRPQVGKTFVARLLIDFLRLKGTDPVVFDLNPSGDALCDYLPDLAQAADLTEIKSQMAMFDRLIVDDAVTKVVDLGHTSFERFFTIAGEIGFFNEAIRRSVEPVVLFLADPHSVAINAYADLSRRPRDVITIPVFNDGALKGQKLRKEFPFQRAAAVPLCISALSPMLKAQIENSRYSFAEIHEWLPPAIPIGLAFELRSWTRRTFLEFRELELRLLLEKLRASLPEIRL
jgi:hypothetical protein